MAQLIDLAKDLVSSGNRVDIFQYPSTLSFDSKVNANIKTIHSYTNPQRLFKKEGLSGWEYAFSVFFLIDELYASPILSGSYEQVQISHAVSFKTIPVGSDKVSIEMEMDKRKYKTKPYPNSSFKGNLLRSFIISLHSHPTELRGGKSYTSFFSPQDMHALLYGSIPMIGLVTYSDIWIFGRSKTSQNIALSLLQQVSTVLNDKGSNEAKKLLKDTCAYANIAMYQGRVGGGVSRFL